MPPVRFSVRIALLCTLAVKVSAFQGDVSGLMAMQSRPGHFSVRITSSCNAAAWLLYFVCNLVFSIFLTHCFHALRAWSEEERKKGVRHAFIY